MSVKVVSLESNLACGKSTLMSELMKRPVSGDYVLILIPEPVKLWMDIKVGDDNILTAFYKNKSEVALPFQLIALLTRKKLFDKEMARAKKIAENRGKKVILVTERTVHSDKHIFAKMLHHSGEINDAGIVAYNMWNDHFSKDSPVDSVIYINIPPEICHKRLLERARPGEDVISLEYLKTCQDAHDVFYNEVLSKMDCMTIDTSNILKDTDEYDKLVDSVIEFITA